MLIQESSIKKSVDCAKSEGGKLGPGEMFLLLWMFECIKPLKGGVAPKSKTYETSMGKWRLVSNFGFLHFTSWKYWWPSFLCHGMSVFSLCYLVGFHSQ